MRLSMDQFEDKLGARAERERQPLSCLFEITPRCNLRCHFCYVALDPYQGPYLDTTQAAVWRRTTSRIERGQRRPRRRNAIASRADDVASHEDLKRPEARDADGEVSRRVGTAPHPWIDAPERAVEEVFELADR